MTEGKFQSRVHPSSLSRGPKAFRPISRPKRQLRTTTTIRDKGTRTEDNVPKNPDETSQSPVTDNQDNDRSGESRDEPATTENQDTTVEISTVEILDNSDDDTTVKLLHTQRRTKPPKKRRRLLRRRRSQRARGEFKEGASLHRESTRTKWTLSDHKQSGSRSWAKGTTGMDSPKIGNWPPVFLLKAHSVWRRRTDCRRRPRRDMRQR